MLTVVNDPSNMFKQNMIKHAGYIPHIIAEAVAEASSANDFMSCVEAAYGYPMRDINGGLIVNKIYTYPDEEDLFPLVQIGTPFDITVFVYTYSIVGFVMEDHQVIVRMD